MTWNLNKKYTNKLNYKREIESQMQQKKLMVIRREKGRTNDEIRTDILPTSV